MLLTKLSPFRLGREKFTRVFIWLIAEILLNYIGIDDLADYSEFLFEKPITVIERGCEIG